MKTLRTIKKGAAAHAHNNSGGPTNGPPAEGDLPVAHLPKECSACSICDEKTVVHVLHNAELWLRLSVAPPVSGAAGRDQHRHCGANIATTKTSVGLALHQSYNDQFQYRFGLSGNDGCSGWGGPSRTVSSLEIATAGTAFQTYLRSTVRIIRSAARDAVDRRTCWGPQFAAFRYCSPISALPPKADIGWREYRVPVTKSDRGKAKAAYSA